LPEDKAVRQEARSVLLPDLHTMNPLSNLCTPPFTDVTIPSDPAEARRVQEEIEQLLQTRSAHDHDIFSIRLALEEALVNAIKHGNQMDRAKKVFISYRFLNDRFEVLIADEGPGFDPTDVPDPTAVENLERPCGRGLMLMRHYMSEVNYNQRGNTVSMKKLFRASNGK
jgi:serine/threonine-protein kinase RsbW